MPACVREPCAAVGSRALLHYRSPAAHAAALEECRTIRSDQWLNTAPLIMQITTQEALARRSGETPLVGLTNASPVHYHVVMQPGGYLSAAQPRVYPDTFYFSSPGDREIQVARNFAARRQLVFD